MSNVIDLLIAELSEQRRWSIVLKNRTTFLVFIEDDAQGSIQSGGQLMTSHPGCSEWVSNIVLHSLARVTRYSQQAAVITEEEDRKLRSGFEFLL